MTKEKPDVREELYDLMTREKFVYRIIEDHGPVTTQEIMEIGRMSRWVVKRSEKTLKGQNLIEERHSIDNPNKKRYAVSDSSTGKRTPLEKYAEGGSGK